MTDTGDQARLIVGDPADAAVLRIRRVMTEALGRGRIADTTGGRWRAVWPLGNSNDLTVELDLADDAPPDLDALSGRRTPLDDASTRRLTTHGDVAGLPIDSTPTIVLRSALGAAATVDAILATLDVPALAAEPIVDLPARDGSITDTGPAELRDGDGPSSPDPVIDVAADDAADDGSAPSHGGNRNGSIRITARPWVGMRPVAAYGRRGKSGTS